MEETLEYLLSLAALDDTLGRGDWTKPASNEEVGDALDAVADARILESLLEES